MGQRKREREGGGQKGSRTRDEGKSRKAEKGMRSLVVRALARQHIAVHPVRSLIIFPVAAEGKVAAARCY